MKNNNNNNNNSDETNKRNNNNNDDTVINVHDSDGNGNGNKKNVSLNELENNNNNYINIKNQKYFPGDCGKEEVKSMSKIINRSTNLTKSEPSSPNNDRPLESSSNGAVVGSTSNKTSPTSGGGLQTVQSYPDLMAKSSILRKAQELPYEISVNDSLYNSGTSRGRDKDDGDPSSDEEDEDGKKKKKKRSVWKSLFNIKMFLIIILGLLVLVSAVGVIARIFWENVTLVDVILLRWALYLDVCIAGFILIFWIVRTLISLFESTLFLQQHVYYYINGFVRPLSCLIWAIVVYFTTQPILQLPSYTDEKMADYYVTLRAVMYVSLLYCARVALVKILAQRTNRKAFYESLKKSLLDEELLEQLSTHKSTNILGQSVSSSVKRQKRMGISQWIESVKKRSTLSIKLHYRADSSYQMKDAKRVAKQILMNADRAKKGYLVQEDFIPYVKEKHIQRAYDTFGSLHGDIITKSDIANWVLRVVRHRKTLEYRLRDHEDIGRVINEIINFFFWILIFLFVLTLYGVDISVFLVPLSTTILGLSFAFGTTLRNVFESLILIFFVRPFEVGDKIVVGDKLDAFIVDRIGILFTSFKSTDGKAVYMPNSILVVSKIENHQRSEEVWVGIDLTVDLTTPVEKLYHIEYKFNEWTKSQPTKWRQNVSLTFVSIEGTNRITVKYGASIISSWQNGNTWRPIKNELFFKMKEWISDARLETHSGPVQLIELVSSPPDKFSPNNNNNNNNNTPIVVLK